MGLYLQQMIE